MAKNAVKFPSTGIYIICSLDLTVTGMFIFHIMTDEMEKKLKGGPEDTSCCGPSAATVASSCDAPAQNTEPESCCGSAQTVEEEGDCCAPPKTPHRLAFMGIGCHCCAWLSYSFIRAYRDATWFSQAFFPRCFFPDEHHVVGHRPRHSVCRADRTGSARSRHGCAWSAMAV